MASSTTSSRVKIVETGQFTFTDISDDFASDQSSDSLTFDYGDLVEMNNENITTPITSSPFPTPDGFSTTSDTPPTGIPTGNPNGEIPFRAIIQHNPDVSINL